MKDRVVIKVFQNLEIPTMLSSFGEHCLCYERKILQYVENDDITYISLL
jgi:hypothetical protein